MRQGRGLRKHQLGQQIKHSISMQHDLKDILTHTQIYQDLVGKFRLTLNTQEPKEWVANLEQAAETVEETP